MRLERTEELLLQRILQHVDQERLERVAAVRALEDRLAVLERATNPGYSGFFFSNPVLAEVEDQRSQRAPPIQPPRVEEEEGDEYDCFVTTDPGLAKQELQDQYSLQESTWDGSVFIFTRPLHTIPSVVAIVVLALNILTQVFFIYMVGKYLNEDAFSGNFLLSLLKFRAGVAHNPKYADLVEGHSLATQVCMQDEKVPYAGMQMGLVSDIRSARQGGQFLCLLAILLWLLTLIGELDSIVRFFSTIAMHTRGRTQVTLEPRDDGSVRVQLESISHCRFVFITVAIVLPRLAIVCSLAYVGVNFIVVTAGMGDLILNSMALAFTIEVDNMLYAAFAPLPLKLLVRDTTPIDNDRSRASWMPKGLSAFAKLVLVAAVLMTVYHNKITPFYWRMNQAYKILCSGKTNLIAGINEATGFVELAASFEDAEDTWSSAELIMLSTAKIDLQSGPGFTVPREVQEWLQSPKEQAVVRVGASDVQERLAGEKLRSTELRPSRSLMQEVRMMGLMSASELLENFHCIDMGGSGTGIQTYRLHLQKLTGSVGTCAEAMRMCSWRNMSSLRAICPVTCGCRDLHDPAASFFAGPLYGCPPSCQTVAQEEVHLAAMSVWHPVPCADVDPAVFGQDKALKRYIRLAINSIPESASQVIAVRSELMASGPYVGIPSDKASDAFKFIVDGGIAVAGLNGQWDLAPGLPHPRNLQGCQFWTSWEVTLVLQMDLCSSDKWRSLRPYCPESCGCTGHHVSQCPPACGTR